MYAIENNANLPRTAALVAITVGQAYACYQAVSKITPWAMGLIHDYVPASLETPAHVLIGATSGFLALYATATALNVLHSVLNSRDDLQQERSVFWERQDKLHNDIVTLFSAFTGYNLVREIEPSSSLLM